jgi:ABC-type lipoprotein export system ATPase subunit
MRLVNYNFEITLNNLVPNPLLQADTSKSEVWNIENLKLRAGDFYLIIADSGKGKTSLLSILFGHRNDYQGEVFINQKNLRDYSSREIQQIRRNDISMVFQGLQLFDDLSAIENIQLKNRLVNAKSDEEIFKMAKFLDVDSFLEKKIITLSFGQKQRIAIIRALCSDYKFLFLDEAFSHLDEINSLKAWELIKEDAQNKNAGIIINSLKKIDFIKPSIIYKL